MFAQFSVMSFSDVLMFLLLSTSSAFVGSVLGLATLGVANELLKRRLQKKQTEAAIEALTKILTDLEKTPPTNTPPPYQLTHRTPRPHPHPRRRYLDLYYNTFSNRSWTHRRRTHHGRHRYDGAA